MERLALSVLLVCVACIACSGKTLSIELTDPEIELDAFSGRRNPRWLLTASEQRTLQDKLSNLLATTRTDVPPARLGYRGFYIHDHSLRIQVAHGLIIVTGEERAAKVFADRHGVERFLVTLATRRGYGGVIARD